jgi:hypothetical protein
MKILTILTLLAAGSLLTASAAAQTPAGGGTPGSPPPPAQGQVSNQTKIAGVESKDVAATGFDDPNSPFEKADTTYHFIGARFRYVIVPKFYMGIFADGGATVGVPAFGPEFTIRKNGFEYVMSAMYASYAMNPTPFKSKTDPNDAWEVVETSVKSIYLMSDFLWSAETSPKFAFTYGGGFGLGVVFGDIRRQQAHPGTGSPNDPSSYVPCTAQGMPNPMYCGRDNDHYGNYTEASWANGGSKPILFPWVSLQTGFRFKPTKQFMGRFDVGWNILNGPFFGLALNYGLI